MKTYKLVLRGGIFFYLSFFIAGTEGIATQMFLQNYYAGLKEVLLPLIFLLGTFAYMMGVFLSHKYLEISIIKIRILFLLHTLCFLGLLTTHNVFSYTILYILSCFLCYFMYNYMDNCYCSASEISFVNIHIRSLLVFQMLGYIISPLFFSITGTNYTVRIVVICLVAAVTGISTTIMGKKNYDKNERKAVNTDIVKQKSISLSADEKLFFAYVILFLSVLSIFVSMIAYIIADYYKFSNYSLKSGITLMLTSASSCVAVLILNHPQEIGKVKNLKHRYFRGNLQLVVVAATLVMGLLLLLKLSDSFAYFLLVSVITGFFYGIFLSTTRKFAVVVSKSKEDSLFLSHFNNTQNIAYLIGYILTVIVWAIKSLVHIDFYFLLFTVIMAILVSEIAIIMVLRFRHSLET